MAHRRIEEHNTVMIKFTQAWLWRTVVVTLLALSGMISAKIMITKVDYDSNPNYLSMSVQVNNETEGSTVDVDTSLYMDVHQGISVSIDLDSKMDNEYMTMIGTSKDLCSKEEGGIDPVVPMLNEEMGKFGNLTFGCPYYKGTYSMRRFRMSDDHMLVKMVPPGEYVVKMDLKHQGENSTAKVQVFKMAFFFEIF